MKLRSDGGGRGSVPGDVLAGLAIVVGYALVAMLAAVLWRFIVPLPRFTVTSQGAGMDAIQLARVVGIDGWFAAIAAPLGLVLGLLVAWRLPDRPRLSVVSSALGGIAAAFVMVEFGRLIGPGSPGTALQHAAVGASAPMQLRLHAEGVALLWPAFAVLGSLLILLTVVPREDAASSPASAAEPLR